MALTILVAKDNLVEGVDICDTCEEAGYLVEGPHDGLCDAMLALQKGRPDLAILDLQLKDGAIYEFARKLRDENVPIIFQSIAAKQDDLAAAFPGSANLAAPCPPARFIDAINRMLVPV